MGKVLLVDNDATYQKLLEKKLNDFFAEKLPKAAGANVVNLLTAEDDKGGIELIKKNKVDLLVIGINMPKTDGLHLLSYINEHHPDMPCIVIIPRENPELKDGLTHDIVHFLEKPFKPSALGKKILTLLQMDTSESGISGVSLANFLQIIEMEEQSCILKIETLKKETGYFCFKDGKLYDATFGEYKGEEAAIRMIPLKTNKIDIRDLPHPNPKKRISIDYLMPLIARALKTVKERGKTTN